MLVTAVNGFGEGATQSSCNLVVGMPKGVCEVPATAFKSSWVTGSSTA